MKTVDSYPRDVKVAAGVLAASVVALLAALWWWQLVGMSMAVGLITGLGVTALWLAAFALAVGALRRGSA